MNTVFSFLTIFCIFLEVFFVSGKQGYGPGDQDWGYIDVRQGVHMFYWLFYTTADVPNYTDRPLIIYLDGGPGIGSTGPGNFEIFGPLDVDGNYRNNTWVKKVNVLFVDNPVGSGYSYADSDLYFCKDNKQIASDLLELMKKFYELHNEFENVPFHIFAASYGGKMSSQFALELYKAVQDGYLRSNLKSITMGNPWISPNDTVSSYPKFLYQSGFLDEQGFEILSNDVKTTINLYRDYTWAMGTAQTLVFLKEVCALTGVYLPNVGKPVSKKDLCTFNLGESNTKLVNLMRGPVAKALNIPSNVQWGSQQPKILLALAYDFPKSVLHIVNELLTSTKVKVGVFSGIQDSICPTPGTLSWLRKLEWNFKIEYVEAERNKIFVNDVLEGFEKIGGNLSMFWIDRAGHNALGDSPAPSYHILKTVTKYED